MKENNWTFNVSGGGQVNVANDNAIMYVTQNNGISTGELDNIIKGIMNNLSGLNKEDADEIINVVDMAKMELSKPEPKAEILRKCVTLIAPMISIANGIPTLTSHLQKLVDFITAFIQ